MTETSDLNKRSGVCGGHWDPVGRLLLVLMAIAGLARCRTPARIHGPAPLAAEAVALHDEGLALLWRGDEERALQRFEAAVAREPGYVSAHRQRQILLAADFRRGELLQEYQAFLEQDPADPRRQYLLGRLASDPRRQEQAFRRIHRRDPEQPWVNYGLGQLAMLRGDPETAEAHYRQGLRADPDLRELRLGLARSLLGQAQLERADGFLKDLMRRHPGDPDVLALQGVLLHTRDGVEAALHWLGRRLAREPWMDAVAEQALSLLAAEGTQAHARWMVSLLRPIRPPEPSQAFGSLLFRAAAQAGDWPLAADTGGGLMQRGVSRDRDWRRALFRTGRWSEALVAAASTFDALERLGEDVSIFRRAVDQAAACEADGTEAERRAFAETLRALGWSEEALVVLEHAAPSELQQDLRGQLAFEAELEALARDAYRDFELRGEMRDLDSFLDEVRGASVRILGRDLVEDAARVEIPVVGSLLDPDPTGGGSLATYFSERGRLVVIGRRVGHPPEVFLAPRIAAGTVGTGSAYLAWVEGEHIPFFLQSVGARLSGAALVRFVYLDAARIVEQTEVWREFLEAPAGAEVPPMAAHTSRGRATLEEPADLLLRLMRRAHEDYQNRSPAGDWEGFLAEALEEVLVHEATHLQDEELLLDLGLHWITFLPQFLRRGFQPDELQAWAELRAQCGALRAARNPYLALVNVVGFLPPSPFHGGGPHADAYEDLMQRFVGVLEESTTRFPSLDPRANLLQQVDRLEPAEIHWVAEKVARDLGLGKAAKGR